MNIRMIFLSLIALMLHGCAVDSFVGSGENPTHSGLEYIVNIDAIDDPSIEKQFSYVLYPMYDNVDIDSLQYKEYARYINKALNKAGFKKVTPPLSPEIVIFVNYSVKETYRSVDEYDQPYLNSIELSAYDYEELTMHDNEVIVWNTLITSRSTDSDLRTVFPILLAPSSTYIGANTKGIISFTISKNDDRVLEIKGI